MMLLVEYFNVSTKGTWQSALFPVITSVRDIALDVDEGKIYWVDLDDVWCANLDGSGSPSILFGGMGGFLRAIAIDPERVISTSP